MKNRLCASLVATFCGVLAFSSLSAAEKVVTWSLDADWEKDVSFSLVDGYRVIMGESLVPRVGHGSTGDPDLPLLPVTLDHPTPGSFVSLDVEATWTAVESGIKPMPIFEPTPIGSTSTFPTLNETYKTTYPATCTEQQSFVLVDRQPKVSVFVTPFKWDGATETLYKAKTITIKATFTVPDPGIKMPLKSTTVPCPTSESTAAYGDDHTADFVIISPPKFVALWIEYAKFRKGTKVGASHTFAVKSTADIYNEYADGDDPLKIHHYIEHLYAKGNLKYILLGAAPRKAGYNRETMIPGRYVSVGTSPNGQILDQYYACMDRLPLTDGVETGKEVWDWNGDGVYIGTKNSDGSYGYETDYGVGYVDAVPDIVVFRFPLMDRVVEEQRTTTNYGYSYVVNSRTTKTAGEIITNFMAKVSRAEADDFAGRYGACYGGSKGFTSSRHSSNASGPLIDERAFFDGGLNMFDPKHPEETTDGEGVPRDRNWDHFTRNRASDDTKTIILADSYKSASASTFYAASGEVFNILGHGWARGCSPLDVTSIFFSTGIYKIYCCPIPCDSGMMDYCASGSSGVTNTISVGEAPILSPEGGALASFFNTRNGWYMGYSTSANNGGSGLSVHMDYLLFGALSGSFTNGEPLNAGEALKLAVKKYGANTFKNHAGYSSLQVTGFGDPLVTFSPQTSRVWDKTAANTTWSTTEKSWLLTNGTEQVSLDYSTTLAADLTGKGDVSFTVDGAFAAANLVLAQDADATATLAGAGHLRTTKETVVTNGNLCWEVAGGAGRGGVRFVGARGDLILPGDATRYFGDTFSNVGTIRVTGSNVTIDTPRNAKYGSGGNVDLTGLAFVGEGETPLTNNVLRSRTRKFFPSTLVVPVVNANLALQCVDAPALAATNATITTAVNPLWQRLEFLRPLGLCDSTLLIGYETTRLGSEDGDGLDLTAAGSSRIESKTDLPVNEDLRIAFAGSSPVLTIAAPIVSGVKGAKVSLSGAGTLKLAAKVSLDAAITVGDGQTLECTAADVVGNAIVVEKGGTLTPDVLPLTGLKSVTVKSGGALRLPEPTQSGLWRLVDATSTTITLEEGALVYDKDGTLLSGKVTQGYYILSSSELTWKATTDGLWNTNTANTASWETAEGVASAYANGMRVTFKDFEGVSEVAVSVGDNVAPKFILFENAATRYVFSPVVGTDATLTIDSLVLSTPLTFKNPLSVRDGIGVTASDLVFGDISAPKLEIAKGATARVTGTLSSSVKKLRFEFSATQNASQKTAIGEFRLFDAAGHFYLPVGTVIRDSDGESMTVTSTTPQNDEGQSVSGSSGNEKLAALIDGKLGSNNKWWAWKTSASVTWFEIVFPEAVSGLVGYKLATSDYRPRDPKAWKVYAGVEEDSLEQIAEVTGHTGANAYQWYTNSAGENLFTFDKPLSASLRVYEGGTLHLDGTLVGALTAESGAILKSDGSTALKGNGASLVVPSEGTVTVDLTAASETSTAFPVLTGFNVSADDFHHLVTSPSTATLLLKDGDVYAATSNVREGPYAATVSESTNWSALTFTDGAGKTFTWGEVNTRPDANITLTVTADATVTMDASGTAGTLTITGAGNVTLNANGGAFIPTTIDDSAHTGALVWNLPIGSTKVVAGAKTTISGGVAGSGLLTVGAGKRAELGAGVSFAEYAIDKAATVRFLGTRENVVLADFPEATYGFENATLTGSFNLAGYTLSTLDGDFVTFKGSSSDGWETLLMNFDIAGGTVSVDATSVKTRFGSSGDTLTTFKMTGGTFAYNGVGAGTGEGLVLGDGSETNETTFVIQIDGGTFSVSNAFVSVCRASSFKVGAGGLLRMKGLASSGATAAISLASDDDAKPARLEIGSLGLARTALTSFSMEGAVEIVAFESGASVAGLGSVGAEKKTALRFGALEESTLMLEDLALTRGAETTIAFGSSANDMTGVITPTLTLTGLGAWTLESGTVDMSAVRDTGDMTLAAKPTLGTIRVLLGYSEYVGRTSFNLFTCGDWAKELDDAALRAFVSPLYENAKGEAKDAKTARLSSDGKTVILTRDDSSTRSISVTATVTAGAAWSSLSWTKQDGAAYSGDWSDVASAELVVGESTTVEVTLDKQISVPRLVTNVKGSLTVSAGSGSLVVTEYLNDSASTGTTCLAATVGQDGSVDAGLALTFIGASDKSITYDRLNVPTNGVVTIVDGTWNGAIKIPNTSSKIIYKSTNAAHEIYHADGLKGTVEYRLPITVDEAVFGSTDGSAATGTFVLGDGASLNPSTFVVGAGKGTSITMSQTNGVSLTVTGSSDTSFVLARDSGSVVRYAVQGGTFVSDSAPLVLGGEGKASLSFSGSGTYRLKGIRGNSSSSLSIGFGSSLTIGSGGISLATSSETPFNGTITTTADATINAPKGLRLSNAASLVASEGTTMHVNAPIVTGTTGSEALESKRLYLKGSGTVCFDTDQPAGGYIYHDAGTLRLAKRGILGSRYIWFTKNEGCKIEVLLTDSEAKTNGAKYELYKAQGINYVENGTDESYVIPEMTKVYNATTGEEVSGTISYERTNPNNQYSTSGTAYFTVEYVAPSEVVGTTISRPLPVTGEEQAFTYVYKPAGTDAQTWATTSNWKAVEISKATSDGAISTNYVDYTIGIAPGCTGGKDPTWNPVLLDGVTVTAAQLEGWKLQYGLYNGAKVTISNLVKFQGDPQFIAVDETSSLTINGWGGKAEGTHNFYVAAPSGIVFNVAFNASTSGGVANYYLGGSGSVCYANGFSGTHTLKRATIELGDATLTGRKIEKKYLVIGSGTLTTSGATVEGGTLKSSTVAVTDAVGSYFIAKDDTGWYIEWVAYAEKADGVFFTDTAGTIYEITDAFTKDANGAWILDRAKSVKIKDSSGEETIFVVPELATIEDDEAVGLVPFVLVESKPVLGVRTIPGLTYGLYRATDLNATWTYVKEEKANGRRVKFEDDSTPSGGKAFYQIRVRYVE